MHCSFSMFLSFSRMGSFNTAPKINNVDSQDDGLELPAGLDTSALLQHVQQLRGGGIEQPSLLTRGFLKPLPVDEDVADGLRCLQLNSVSRGRIASLSCPRDIYSNVFMQFAVRQLRVTPRTTFDCCNGTFYRKVSIDNNSNFINKFQNVKI